MLGSQIESVHASSGIVVNSSERPAISVLTPAWNSLPYIQDCVRSVLSQSFDNWEFLISDDFSTDGTRDYLRAVQHPRVRVFEQDSNLGIFGNLNFLLEHARAPISLILCADDYLFANGLATVFKVWNQQPESVAAVFFNWLLKKGRTSQLFRYCQRVIPSVIQTTETDLYFFLFGNLAGNLSNTSVRTMQVAEAGWFRPDVPYAGDFEFWVRLGRRSPLHVSPFEISFVRRHPGAASNFLNKNGELVSQQMEILDNLFLRLEGRFPRFLLRLHATLNYDILQRYAGVRKLLRQGSVDYIQNVRRASHHRMFLNPFFIWCAFFISLGGHWGRDIVPRLVLRRHAAKRGHASGNG